MPQHLLAIDDVAEDFEKILRWAIEFKRLVEAKRRGGSSTSCPLTALAIGSIYEKTVHPHPRLLRGRYQPSWWLPFDPSQERHSAWQVRDGRRHIPSPLPVSLGGMTYRCFSHDDVAELAKHADVPVLNALVRQAPPVSSGC